MEALFCAEGIGGDSLMFVVTEEDEDFDDEDDELQSDDEEDSSADLSIGSFKAELFRG